MSNAPSKEFLSAAPEQPSAWYWDEDGPEIVGKVVGARRRDTAHADGVLFVTLETAEGERRSVLMTAVLERAFIELRATRGEWVRIGRGEKVKGASGYSYWKGYVLADRPEQDIDYDALDASADEAMLPVSDLPVSDEEPVAPVADDEAPF